MTTFTEVMPHKRSAAAQGDGLQQAAQVEQQRAMLRAARHVVGHPKQWVGRYRRLVVARCSQRTGGANKG